MRIHCIGPGSIGSLVCFHLRPIAPVTLLLRKRQAQHRRSPPLLSIQVEHHGRSRSLGGFEYEFLDRQRQEPIESLIVTTKAHHVLDSLRPILHRLSPSSTLVLLHNGLGVVEDLIEQCFRDPSSRPSFILAITSHAVCKAENRHRAVRDSDPPLHGRFCHAGQGDIRFGVLPSQMVTKALEHLANQTHWYPDEDDRFQDSSDWSPAQKIEGIQLSKAHNPILNPSLNVSPNLKDHLPYLRHSTHSLYLTIAALLHESMVEQLKTKWLSMVEFQTCALVKLAVNAAINPVTALVETRNSGLRGQPSFDSLSDMVCQEASAVFSAQLGHPVNPYHPLSAAKLQQVVKTILTATATNISSMCADVRSITGRRISDRTKFKKLYIKRVRAGDFPIRDYTPSLESKNEDHDRTEIDYINGYICKLGQKYQIDTKVNQMLRDLIKLKCETLDLGESLPRLRRINPRNN